MGCNCKNKGIPINQLRNKNLLKEVIEIYNRLLKNKTVDDLSDLDWMELYTTWGMLYPNAKGQPSKEILIRDIENAIKTYEVVFVKKR